MIAAEKIVGIHKRDQALVIDNDESLRFCTKCLADVPDAEIDFDNQDPCVICQLPGGPVVHARAIGMKHDFTAPEPETPPYSDVELSAARAQVPNVMNAKNRTHLARLIATVDYWMEEARREADLRQPAIDERDALRHDLHAVMKEVETAVESKVTAARHEMLTLRAAALRASRIYGVGFGFRWEILFEFKLQDAWIGAHWTDVKVPIDYGKGGRYGSEPEYWREQHVWICLVPCFPIHIIRSSLPVEVT